MEDSGTVDESSAAVGDGQEVTSRVGFVGETGLSLRKVAYSSFADGTTEVVGAASYLLSTAGGESTSPLSGVSGNLLVPKPKT